MHLQIPACRIIVRATEFGWDIMQWSINHLTGQWSKDIAITNEAAHVTIVLIVLALPIVNQQHATIFQDCFDQSLTNIGLCHQWHELV